MENLHLSRRCNKKQTIQSSTKPSTTTWLTSVSPQQAPTNNPDLPVVAIECYTEWQYESPDEDLASYNPTEGPFSYIQDAFDSSIALEKILLDAVKLPQDNCQAISIAIAKGTARAISNGSYDPLTHKGTSSLTIVADKHDRDPLDGDN
jgi:hypothetical protein